MRTPDIQRARCVCELLLSCGGHHRPSTSFVEVHPSPSQSPSLSLYVPSLSPSIFRFCPLTLIFSSHYTLHSLFSFRVSSAPSLSRLLFKFTCSVSLAVFLFRVCHFSSASPALIFVLSPGSDSIHHVRCGLMVKVTGTERKDEENKRVWRWPHRGLKSLRPYLPSSRCSWTLLFIFLRAIFLSFFHTRALWGTWREDDRCLSVWLQAMTRVCGGWKGVRFFYLEKVTQRLCS